MQIASDKAAPSSYESSVISKLNARLPQAPEVKKKKTKRRKGPNPLSVKKSTKFRLRDDVVPAGVVSRSKVSLPCLTCTQSTFSFCSCYLCTQIVFKCVHVRYAGLQCTLVE